MRYLVMIGALITVGQLAIASTSSAALWRVAITDAAFVPDHTATLRGDTLRWINTTETTQSIKTGSPGGCVQSGPLDIGDIAPSDSTSYVVDFGGAGELYSYFSGHNCPGPTGTIYVGPDLPVLPASWGLIRFVFR